MADRKKRPARNNDPESDLRQARVTTGTAEEILQILKGREVEVVRRGPRKLAEGTFVAEIIATKRVLSDLPKDIGKIEIRPRRKISVRAERVSEGNRYGKKGSVPKGVGIKK